MSSELPSLNPTAYVGVKPTYPGQIYFRKVNPINAKDVHNYDPGDTWINTDTDQIWMLVKIVNQVVPFTKLATWVNITGGGGGGSVTTLTGNVGGPVSPVLGNINVVGIPAQGLQTSGAGNTLTINLVGNPSFFWAKTAGPQVLTPNRGWIATNAAGTIFTLPATSAEGDVVAIQGQGAGGWVIDQLAGQQIIFNSANFTTIGAAGSVSSNDAYDSIFMICVTADLVWLVLHAKGNITLV